MDNPAVFSATLGLSPPWQITSLDLSKYRKTLKITVDFAAGSRFSCPICGGESSICQVDHETWLHHDFFRFNTFLNVRVPRVSCDTCGINAVERPWEKGSNFVKSAETPSAVPSMREGGSP